MKTQKLRYRDWFMVSGFFPLMSLAGALAMLGCTGNSKQTKEEVTQTRVAPPSSVAGEIIVIKSGEKSTTFSNIDRSQWVQFSQTDSQTRDKLYGLLAIGEWQGAIDEAKKQLERVPGNTATMLGIAVAYAEGHNYEMANFYAGLVLKAEPSNSDAMNLAGLRIMLASQNHRGDYEDALAWFRKAADNDNTHIAALLNMGFLQLELGDAGAARESFNQARSRCQKCVPAIYGYGVASSRKGDWSQAKSSFEEILAQNKGAAEAQYQLALIYKNGLNDAQTASKLLQDIVSDADGRFKYEGITKRAANITLRRMQAGSSSKPMPVEAITPQDDEAASR